MFTGIVEEVGSVRTLQRNGRVATLAIGASATIEGVGVGASIAVNGVCLTVVERKPDGFVFEVGPETLARTALSTLGPGDAVNLERPLRFGGALGAPGPGPRRWCGNRGRRNPCRINRAGADHAAEP